MRSLLRFALVLSCLPLAVIAQTTGTPPPSKPSPPPQIIPDFSRAPDPSLYTQQEYQRFDKSPLTFTTTTRYVLVPVVVTDKSGKAVAGLKQADFHLAENGKPRPIASLEEMHSAERTEIRAAANLPGEFSNQLSMAHPSSQPRLVIIAFDMVNTPIADQVRARRLLISYLGSNLDPDCLYQVVSVESDGMHVLHDFTNNTGSLIEAVQKLKIRFSSTDRFDMEALNLGRTGNRSLSIGAGGAASVSQAISLSAAADQGASQVTVNASDDEMRIAQFAALEVPYSQMMQALSAGATLTAFQQIAHRVSGIAGRKSLVWIAGGFPFSLDPSTGSLSTGTAFDVYQHAMQLLSDQLISVYPVDARGLLVLQPDATMKISRSQMVQISALLANMDNRNREIQETMRAFAEMTGGRAFLNRNDIDGAVRDAASDGSTYYLLSYPVDKTDTRQGWRKIAVKVAGYNVRARKGYYLTKATLNPLAGAKYDIDSALSSPFDFTGLPLRVLVENQGQFTLMVAPNAVTVDREQQNRLHLEIAYTAWSETGEAAFQNGKTFNVNLTPEQLAQVAQKGFSYGESLPLKPGKYQLRVVVRDDLSGKIGSTTAEMQIR